MAHPPLLCEEGKALQSSVTLIAKSTLQPRRPPPQIRKPCNGCCCGQANYQKFGLVETLPHAVPFFPQKVTQRDEDRSPTKRPGVGKQRKARKAQLRCAGDVSGQMSHTRDEVSHQKRPTPAAFEPRVHARQSVGAHMNVGAVLHQDVGVEDTAKRVAYRDSSGAAAKCCGECRDEQQCPLENQKAGEGKQPFIGNRQADDTEYQ